MPVCKAPTWSATTANNVDTSLKKSTSGRISHDWTIYYQTISTRKEKSCHMWHCSRRKPENL